MNWPSWERQRPRDTRYWKSRHTYEPLPDSKRGTYVPPSLHLQLPEAPKNARKLVDAAAALDLLECDTSTLLPANGPGLEASTLSPTLNHLGPTKSSFCASEITAGRGQHGKSAAQRAREIYAKAAEGASGSCSDVIDGGSLVDGPASGSADIASIASTSAIHENLWPGDVVLARYGPNGHFYGARIVRVYNSVGIPVVDVEWLRPQAITQPGIPCLYNSTLDETLHRFELCVRDDIRRCNPQLNPTPSSSSSSAEEVAKQNCVFLETVPDILDLQSSTASSSQCDYDPIAGMPLSAPPVLADSVALSATGFV